MKKRRLLCAALLAAVMLPLLLICALPGSAAADRGSGDSLDEYLRACVKNAHIPALAVTVVDRDQVVFSGCYGECGSSDTPFLLGSVSKSFTAVCVMQLAEQGKIDLNGKLSDYLPDAADGEKISIGQLLNHSGGLGEHQTLENFHIVNPQGKHHYANVNYSLLGKLIEKVSGLPYEEYVTKNVFVPLGLAHTAATREESVQNGLIDGYTDYWGFQLKRSHRYPSSENAWVSVPAGYLSSSASDLGRYLQMYLRGGEGILSGQSIEKMFFGDTVYVEDDVPFWYGFGWATVREPLPEPVLRHSGLVETGTACVFIIPGSGLGIAITANVNDYFVTNEMLDSLGWGVVLMLLGEAPNEIGANDYLLRHLWIDGVMLGVFAAAALPLCRLPRYRKALGKGRLIQRAVFLGAYHLLLPVFCLLLVPLFFQTPLWVAKAFVPDVYITVVLSAALLFATGAIKAIMLFKAKNPSQ